MTRLDAVLRNDKEVAVQCIQREEACYPEYLRHIHKPPTQLFLKGNSAVLHKEMIAIVGSRKCTEYGFTVAKKLARELAIRGFVIVSGMARGIDEAAHKGALEGGETVAVLGTGVDVCYPKQNQRLYDTIPHQGCIVSELPLGSEPKAYHFPLRNRIISGMCRGVIVVEAEVKSGSLITAQLALEENREVFAVPGNIFSCFSQGTNKLIQAGAKLVTSVEDIVEEFCDYTKTHEMNSVTYLENNKSIPLDKVEIMVYDCLSWQPIQVEMIYDALVHKNIKLSLQSLEMLLLQLEIKGAVQRLPGRRYSRTQ